MKMPMDPIVYSEEMPFHELMKAFEDGCDVVCPTCGNNLVDATDLATANKLGVHRGIYCAADHSHITIMVEVAPDPDFWDRFKKR